MQELLLIKLTTCNQCPSWGDSEDQHRSTSECPMQECLGLLCLLSWRPWDACAQSHVMDCQKQWHNQWSPTLLQAQGWQASILGSVHFRSWTCILSVFGEYIQCKTFSIDWIHLISLFPLHAYFCAHVRLKHSLGWTHLSRCMQLN